MLKEKFILSCIFPTICKYFLIDYIRVSWCNNNLVVTVNSDRTTNSHVGNKNQRRTVKKLWINIAYKMGILLPLVAIYLNGF